MSDVTVIYESLINLLAANDINILAIIFGKLLAEFFHSIYYYSTVSIIIFIMCKHDVCSIF